MINRWGTLFFLLGLCAVLTRAGQLNPEAPVDVSPRYTVDGVALGMTEDEVRARWGDVQVIPSFEGVTILHKSCGQTPFENGVLLNAEGKVTLVCGTRLRLQGKTVLARGGPYDYQTFGGRMVQKSVDLGPQWKFSRYSFEDGGAHIEVSGLEHGRVLAVSLGSAK